MAGEPNIDFGEMYAFDMVNGDKTVGQMNVSVHHQKTSFRGENEITKQGLNTLKDLILLVSKIPEIYKNSNLDEKRKVLKLMYSNLFLQWKSPLFSIRKPLKNILSGGFRHVWSGLSRLA